MAQPISRDWDRDAEFRPNNRQRSTGFERSQYGMDDEMPPQIPAGDKTRNRVWRAMSWVLLANVVLFLASPLSAYVTGIVVDINGGSYMG